MKQHALVHQLRRTVYTTAAWTGLLSRGKPQISVYCYHSFANDNWDFSVSLDMLKRQIEYLLGVSSPITEKELIRVMKDDTSVTASRFLITIDDGYKNVLDALPVFREYNIKPLLFVLADPERANRKSLQTDLELLSSQEVRDLSLVWDIGSHGATHQILAVGSEKILLREITESKQLIESVINKPVYSFSFPKGRYTEEAVNTVQQSGYTMAFSMDSGVIGSQTSTYRIPRVGISNYHIESEFKVLATPEAAFVRKIAGAFTGERYE